MQCPKCRTALPPGSMFCNRCGTSLAPPPERTQAMPPPQRTQAMPPPQRPAQGHQTAYGQPAYTQTQYGANPGFNPDRTQAYAPPPLPAEPQRRPIWLLALLLALVGGGVTAGTLLLVKGRQASVVASQTPGLPAGPGVTQSSSPGSPAAPSVVNSRPGTPGEPGKPVTSAPGKPGSDMAPSVVMSQPGTPGQAPSVTQAPTVPLPPAPPVTAAPTRQQPKAPPLVAQPSAPPPVPKGRDAVDDYLAWLKFVESERQALTARATNQSVFRAREFMDILLNLDDPAVDQRMQRLPQESARDFQRVHQSQVQFWNECLKYKPAVPPDCRYLDGFYMEAGRVSLRLGQELAVAFARQDMGQIKRAMSQQSLIDRNLSKADEELRKIRSVRRLPEDWMIQSGGGGGGMGGLGGLGGGMFGF